jgi:hypothetical protein
MTDDENDARRYRRLMFLGTIQAAALIKEIGTAWQLDHKLDTMRISTKALQRNQELRANPNRKTP